jgi:hypothetical protein
MSKEECAEVEHEWRAEESSPTAIMACMNCGKRQEAESLVQELAGDVVSLRNEVARMRLLYVDCAQCGAALEPMLSPPHCDDHSVDEAHAEAWDDAVGV